MAGKRRAIPSVPPELAAITEDEPSETIVKRPASQSAGPTGSIELAATVAAQSGQAPGAEAGVSGTFGLTPLPAVETPEQKSDAAWLVGERQRKRDEERREERLAEINGHAANAAVAARIRQAVYVSRGFPEAGDVGAEEEIASRLAVIGVAEPELTYVEVMIAAARDEGLEIGEGDDDGTRDDERDGSGDDTGDNRE